MIHYLGIIPPVLMARPEEPDEKRHQVRFGLGAGVDPALRVAFEKRFGMTLVEIYGMSEIGSCSADVDGAGRPDAVHRQEMPGLEYQLIDDDGATQPPGTPGELRVRRPGPDPRRGLLKEYLRDPQTTATVWKDGWFHTETLVETPGGLVFVDRKKHMIFGAAARTSRPARWRRLCGRIRPSRRSRSSPSRTSCATRRSMRASS